MIRTSGMPPRRNLAYRLTGLLVGLTLIGCTKGVIVSKWYEPQVDISFQTSLARAARMRGAAPTQPQEIDDADFCVGYYHKNDTLTLYLPYKKWQTVHINDTVRLRTKFYSDWNIR